MSRYMKQSEFTCPCCGLDEIDFNLVKELDDMRMLCGFPFVVNSGCRCEKHNEEVGGKPDSAHIPQSDGKCKAADIKIESSYHRHIFLLHAIRRFNRIGIAKTFIHVDVDKQKPQGVIWIY